MSNDLELYVFKRALIDKAANDDRSQPITIRGYRVVAIATPSAIDAATINGFRIDPGDGTFRTVVDSGGTPLTMGGAMAVDEIQLVPDTKGVSLVGTRFEFDTSAAQTADRNFLVLLERIAG